ncbi:MAG: hypothetical protein UZ03_NOB001001847 [Nitrospira sp. OLB3]|nr:MAG: hypothetical protein UZ03_NOB001001847 [Nitrospira sp. OLB3]MCE7965832.1 DUF3386 domain-containing protein [Nitrospira sp. NTP2]RIK57375.1 MAG: hypothetical protein DCC63_14285 [Nitrospira sp.]
MQTSAPTETRTDTADDPQARKTLQEAFENTARWQPDFKGFSADLTVNTNGQVLKGTVVLKSPREVTVQLPDEAVQKWAQEQIGMIAVHRGPRKFEESDGKYRLTFGAEDGHPFGRRLNIAGDGNQSFYRIKDGRITQINRRMERVAFTINVEESATTQDGKHLTTKYTVYYYSPQDAKLRTVESFTDTHARVGSSDLPGTRRIISYENGEVLVRTLTFQNHKLLA